VFDVCRTDTIFLAVSHRGGAVGAARPFLGLSPHIVARNRRSLHSSAQSTVFNIL